jgi:hypothetical protein
MKRSRRAALEAGLPCGYLFVLGHSVAQHILVIFVFWLRDPLVAVHQPHDVWSVGHLLVQPGEDFHDVYWTKMLGTITSII